MKTGYSVRLTSREAKQFGWSIYEGQDALEHSAQTFDTRMEALIDSARAAFVLCGATLLDTLPERDSGEDAVG